MEVQFWRVAMSSQRPYRAEGRWTAHRSGPKQATPAERTASCAGRVKGVSALGGRRAVNVQPPPALLPPSAENPLDRPADYVAGMARGWMMALCGALSRALSACS